MIPRRSMLKLLGLVPFTGLALLKPKLLDGDPDRLCDGDGAFLSDNPAYHRVEAFDRRTGKPVSYPNERPGPQWWVKELNVKKQQMLIYEVDPLEKSGGRIQIATLNGGPLLRKMDFPAGVRLNK